MTRKLSFSYLNELLKLLGMLIWSSFIFHVVLEIFRLRLITAGIMKLLMPCEQKQTQNRKKKIKTTETKNTEMSDVRTFR